MVEALPKSMLDIDAKNMCFEKYDFVQKPLYMDNWLQFLRELRKLELRWSLEPGVGGIYVLKIMDHSEDGGSLLAEVKGHGNLCIPIADFFETCGNITSGIAFEGSVVFAEPGGKKSILKIEALKRIGAEQDDEPPIIPYHRPQYNCRGISVNIALINMQTKVRTPLFNDISLQAVNYAFLSSIPAFMKRNDIGIKNADFISKDQKQHFRFAWCFLRKESWLTPVEMGELDLLLPP
ncbi:hypothetical protein STCU_09648 [Strigomonas culicis]|nr:hypothetical protein STCU_09648 [Strigomonas culicis]|eukprot:EPY19056.1 hypothetical protein STCU_09648 [Strigomonas culicis]